MNKRFPRSSNDRISCALRPMTSREVKGETFDEASSIGSEKPYQLRG